MDKSKNQHNIENKIKDFILNQDRGSISIAKYMEMALYDAKYGYYIKNHLFGKKGDFVTAPEISQVFGEVIALYFISYYLNVYKPLLINKENVTITLIEMGAGEGTLMYDMLSIIMRFAEFSQKLKIKIIEISPNLTKRQKHKLKIFRKQIHIEWVCSLDDISADFNLSRKNNFSKNKASLIGENILFFVANELLDALPFYQFQKQAEFLYERVVSVSDNNDFEIKLESYIGSEALASLKLYDCINTNQTFIINSTTAILKNRFRTLMPNGGILEISPKAIDVVKKIGDLLSLSETKGVALLIDYGYIENKFIDSFQSVKGHQYNNIFNNIADADLTYLVDFALLKQLILNDFKNSNLQASIIEQGEFLKNLSIEERGRMLISNNYDTNNDINKVNEITKGIDRLIDCRQMGKLFKVLQIVRE